MEGVEGLSRLGSIADSLMLRTGGCSGNRHVTCNPGGPARAGRRPAARNVEPTRPVAINARPLADDELAVIGDLDELVETAMCSCDAGDDVPY
ncbi:hypothetical protein [Streptomyces chiangmaiensis]|uniref:hypothetical protein n=1 Tax=Streptomyces chiangmaiensis TaxID=766497 RepID=UPI003379A4C4